MRLHISMQLKKKNYLLGYPYRVAATYLASGTDKE